jgi:hypothetical protein
LPRPAPKKVAMAQAHSVLRPAAGGAEAAAGLFIVGVSAASPVAQTAQVLENFGIQDR